MHQKKKDEESDQSQSELDTNRSFSIRIRTENFRLIKFIGQKKISSFTRWNFSNKQSNTNDNNLSSELANLNNLLKDGVLTQEEFDKAKKKILDN